MDPEQPNRTAQFKEVQVCFFQKVPAKEIFKKESEWMKKLTTREQEEILHLTVLSEINENFPIALEHQKKFLKAFIQLMEDANLEVADALYESYAALISSVTIQEELHFKTFILEEGGMLTLEESTRMLSHGTTGLQIWPAALWLAEWILENPDVFENKSVLELGCGVGFTGLFTALTCNVQQYVFTDWHRKVLQSLCRNLNLNLKQRRDARLCRNCLDNFDNPDSDSDIICTTLRYSADTLSVGSCKQLKKSGRDCVERWQDSSKLESCSCKLTLGERKDKRTKVDKSSYGPEGIEITGGENTSLDGMEEEEEEEEEDLLEVIGDGKEDGAGGTVHLASLDWEQADCEVKRFVKPDVVLAADVIFEPKLLPSLAETLKMFLNNQRGNEVTAYIASSVRNEETFAHFLSEIDSSEIEAEEVNGPSKEIFHFDRSCPMKLLKLYSRK
ncbi:protein-lysine N-methyltransferase EEF2KMT-like isoform X2 [Apostichopus japonicus]|uniref:protein-lysine N-methyltransferase EEF2KMT-like isoform X2 n=1 Tax=Stichopus japonicus TaxID=307972 RepID=UPI003AB7ABBB